MPSDSTFLQIKKYLKKKVIPFTLSLSWLCLPATMCLKAWLVPPSWAAQGAVSSSLVAPNTSFATEDVCGNYCFYTECRAEKKMRVGCNAARVSWSRPLESSLQKPGINQLADKLPSWFPAK